VRSTVGCTREGLLRGSACQQPNFKLSQCCHSPSNTVTAAVQPEHLLVRCELFLYEGHISLGQGQQVHVHLQERCEPVVDDPEVVVEVWIDFVLCEERV
jgi:hypothetical protein